MTQHTSNRRINRLVAFVTLKRLKLGGKIDGDATSAFGASYVQHWAAWLIEDHMVHSVNILMERNTKSILQRGIHLIRICAFPEVEVHMARPREFDEGVVLEHALRAFWLHGYEGTTLQNLMAATGLNKSSLYKTFGSKDDLFLKVVDLYHDRYLSFREDALGQPTPRIIVEHLLRGIVALQSGEDTPPGCLITNSALVCSSGGERMRTLLVRRRQSFEPRLEARFAQLDWEKKLPSGMTCQDAAALVGVLINGLAVQAKSGSSRSELERVVLISMLFWPQD